MNHYQARDIQQLDGDGGYYSRHVSAMTGEGLHDKSDIAAELAYRDAQIDKLQAERDAMTLCVERLQSVLIDAKRCVAVTAYPTIYHAPSYQGLAKRVMRRIEEVGKERAATSLARLKLLAQADELENTALHLESLSGCGIELGLTCAANELNNRALELRQQVEASQ